MNPFGRLAALLLVIIVTFISCQKEADEAINPDPVDPVAIKKKCRINTITLFWEGAWDDSVKLNYQDSLVSKVDQFRVPGVYVKLDYNNEKVARMSYFSPPDFLVFPVIFMTVSYNSDGTIHQIKDYNNPGNVPEYNVLYDFIYITGKLSRVNIYVPRISLSDPRSVVDYTYTGNNITHCRINNIYRPEPLHDYDYTYDTSANYYAPILNQVLFTDPFFTTDEIRWENLPMAISANNASSFTYEGKRTDLSYQLNPEKYLGQVLHNGVIGVSYRYECQP